MVGGEWCDGKLTKDPSLRVAVFTASGSSALEEGFEAEPCAHAGVRIRKELWKRRPEHTWGRCAAAWFLEREERTEKYKRCNKGRRDCSGRTVRRSQWGRKG